MNLNFTFRFNVFGLSQDHYQEDERALKSLVHERARRIINVVAVPYTEDRNELFRALPQNEVSLMLSWHEGFGLVGWESISARLPLIISRRSGLYRLLLEGPPELAEYVTAVDIRGSSDDEPNQHDVDAVANALLSVASNLPEALAKADRLWEYLSERYTWDRCVRSALEACGCAHLLSIETEEYQATAQGRVEHRTGQQLTRGFEHDIERLQRLTHVAHRRQERHSFIRLGDETVRISRQSTNALHLFAQTSSVLVVGDPGAGKSAAQHQVTEALIREGNDVVLLAVDQLAAESLGRLRIELGLQHELIEVLEAWGGSRPGYLIVDALDAARTESTANALRLLISDALSIAKRWHVIASVRKFDLRYGQELQRLFAGRPETTFNDPSFGNVRHLNIPPLDDNEMRQIATSPKTSVIY